MGKGKEYSITEDVFITCAGLRVGEDSITGSDQKREVYIERMYNHYKLIATPVLGSEIVQQQTSQAIRQRYQKIRENCRAFHGKVRQVKHAKVSGIDARIMNDMDICNIATFLFNSCDETVHEAAQKVAVAEAPKPPFPFLDCYKQLRESTGFTGSDSDMSINEKSDGKQASEGSVVDLCKDDYSVSMIRVDEHKLDQRPEGSKKAKRIACEADQGLTVAESAISKIAKVFEEKHVDGDKAMLAVKKREQQIQIATAPNTDPFLSREILKILAKGVLEELRMPVKGTTASGKAPFIGEQRLSDVVRAALPQKPTDSTDEINMVLNSLDGKPESIESNAKSANGKVNKDDLDKTKE